MKQALLIIDVQNEYSSEGNLPIENFEQIVENINMIDINKYTTVITVRHINSKGIFSTKWATEYPSKLNIMSNYDVIKQVADSFQGTNLLQLLENNDISDIEICGFMTQNCITYTALTAKRLGYNTTVLSNLCSTIDSTINSIALKALSSKVTVI